MGLEPDNIHRPRYGWLSEQKRTNTSALGALILTPLMFLLIFLYYSHVKGSFGSFEAAFIILALLSTGVFIVFGLRTNFDQRDTWYVVLPYNRQLFGQLGNQILNVLARNGFRYYHMVAPNPGVLGQVLDLQRRDLHIEIQTGSASNLELRLSLETERNRVGGIDGTFHMEYHQYLRLYNVRADNLQQAYRVQYYLQWLLDYTRAREWNPDVGLGALFG